MITVKDIQGVLFGVCEWRIYNMQGHFEKSVLTYAYEMRFELGYANYTITKCERKNKMCKYCSGDGVIVVENSLIDGEGMRVSFDVGLGDLIIEAECDSGCMRDFITTHISYCPYCGRKL